MFDFYYETLRRVQFSFTLNDDSDAFYQQLISDLTEQYGEPTESKESSSAYLEIHTHSSQWEAENTQLLVVLITGEQRTPSLEIVIGTV